MDDPTLLTLTVDQPPDGQRVALLLEFQPSRGTLQLDPDMAEQAGRLGVEVEILEGRAVLLTANADSARSFLQTKDEDELKLVLRRYGEPLIPARKANGTWMELQTGRKPPSLASLVPSIKQIFEERGKNIGEDQTDERFFWRYDKETFTQGSIPEEWRTVSGEDELLEDGEREARKAAIESVGDILAERAHARGTGEQPKAWGALVQAEKNAVKLIAKLHEDLFAKSYATGNRSTSSSAVARAYARFANGELRGKTRVESGATVSEYLNGEPNSFAFCYLPELADLLVQSQRRSFDWVSLRSALVSGMVFFAYAYFHSGASKTTYNPNCFVGSYEPESVGGPIEWFQGLNANQLKTYWREVLRLVAPFNFNGLRVTSDRRKRIDDYLRGSP